MLTVFAFEGGGSDMPLVYANLNEPLIIKKVGGTDEIRQHLENLGFTVGSEISLITTLNGNLIVKVKESRIALSNELALKIIV